MRQIKYNDITLTNRTSSKGNQGKYHIGDEWIKTDYLGYEAAAEYLSSEILKSSNIKNFVTYSMEKIQIENRNGLFRKDTACISKNFLPDNCEIITLDKLLKQTLNTTFEKEIKGKSTKEAIRHIVDLIETKTGIKDYGKYLTSMFEFDAFVLNEDRHVQNIIFIVNDGKYTPGPIFDNGASFLSDISQEYPLEEKTNKLISFVKSKPFNTSFSKQVEACQELYGKQLELADLNITAQINNIKNIYGDKIADRMQHIYDIQINKNRNLLQIKENESYVDIQEEPLYTEEDMLKEIQDYVANGGGIVTKKVPDKLVKPLKEVLLENEIPFVIYRDKHGICSIFTKDMDAKDFLNAQRKVFSEYQPPEITPEVNKLTHSKANNITEIDISNDIIFEVDS